jgi:hypothetical protein
MFERLVAGIVTYGDWEGLSKTMFSLMGGVDEIIVLHCRFIGYPPEIPESFAKTKQIVHRYHSGYLGWPMQRTHTQFYHYEYKREWLCRQQLLDLCDRHGAYNLLIIDSDEYVVTEPSWAKFRENLADAKREFPEDNVFGINCTHQGGWQHFPRLWYKPWNMMYKFSHYRFCNKGELNHYYDDYDSPIQKVIHGIKIIHDEDHSERSPERIADSKEYGKWLKAEEQWTSENVLNRPMGRAYPDGCSEKDLEYFRKRFANQSSY